MVLSGDLIWFQVLLSPEEIFEKKIPYKPLRKHFFLSVLWQKVDIICGKICVLWLPDEIETLFTF